MRRQPRTPTSYLPAQVTPLVGREREIEEARCRLLHGETRLLTFTGPAGIGKTRLALAVSDALLCADESQTHLRHEGACFVDLASLTDPTLVDSTIAQSLHLGEAAERPPLARIIASLRHRRFLLILDNFEQVQPAAPLVAELLTACPGLSIIATSRSPLHIYGEHDFAVPPLAVPRLDDPNAQLHPEQMLAYPAVALFVQRAKAVSRLFSLTVENAGAVARLCARLDGLPLAIELAATRSKLLSPAAMLERLEAGAAHAPIGVSDRPARHQTLETAIGWSYDLLSKDERRLFRRLAICVGGFNLAAAEAIGGTPDATGAPSGHAGVDDMLAALVDQSLIQAMPREGGETRFTILETIRSFALKQLIARGEHDAAAALHAAHYTALAQQAALAGPRQALWLAELDLEHDNLRAALRWALSRDDIETASRVVGSLWWFWCRRGYLEEGRAWMEETLARAERVLSAGSSVRRDDIDGKASQDSALRTEHSVRARVLNAAGALAWYQGDHAAAVTWLEEGLALSRRLGSRSGAAHALMFLGLVALRRNELAESRARFEESVAIRRSVDDRWGTAMVLTAFAGVPLQAGAYDEARAMELESAALFREVGDRWSLTMPLLGLGLQAFYQGEYDTARGYLEEVLALRREIGDTWSTATTLHSLGEVARASGDPERALALYRESLTTPRALGNSKTVAQCLASVGGIAAACGKPVMAARLQGAAQALFDETGAALPPVEQALREQDLEAARAALGEEAFAAAWEMGRTLPLSQAVQEALDLQIPSSAAPAPAIAGGPTILTRREREVAALVARGMTNRQIARQLTITEGTAGSHIEHMLAKLGFQSRAQIAAWAVAQGLLGGAA